MKITNGRLVAVALAVAVIVTVTATPALAAAAQAPELNQVITSLRRWVAGLLVALATLFLTVGGVLYMAAGGDPVRVEKARTALKSAAIGYGLAALAPVLISALRSIVGGG